MNEVVDTLGVSIVSFYVLAAVVSAAIYVSARLWKFGALALRRISTTDHCQHNGH